MFKQLSRLFSAPILSQVSRSNHLRKSFHLGATYNVKQILETQNGKQLVVEGIYINSPREETLLSPIGNSEACPVCRLNIEIKHTDVLILSQFIRSDGCMLPRRITGLCKKQQKKISRMVSMANKAGILASLLPVARTRDVKSRRKEHHKCNTYYDESTIEWQERHLPKPPKPRDNWF